MKNARSEDPRVQIARTLSSSKQEAKIGAHTPTHSLRLCLCQQHSLDMKGSDTRRKRRGAVNDVAALVTVLPKYYLV
jgi:hypothetical protein